MCGITGIVNYKKNISKEYSIIRNMTTTLTKRGPDEDGLFFAKHVNLGHKRLSIVDIKNGKQPMSCTFRDNMYTVVYNGQIYNAEELRAELKEKGFYFKGHSDTEVLLNAYIYWGKEVCHYLNGIFAFAIWDSEKEELFVARDHFGIKPLYYTYVDENFIFASEIKAILKHPNVKVTLDKTGIAELFGIGPSHTPGISPFKNIFELEPAHFIIYNRNGLKKKEYWKHN